MSEATSAQQVYLDSQAPAEAPRVSGWEYMWNGLTGKWDERVRQYKEAQNEYNAQKLLQQAQWEREDTTYQRLVEDLKKAGINPYYALNQGSISPVGSSNGSDVYSTKGKSSKKEKDDVDLKGLITSAIILMKLLA